MKASEEYEDTLWLQYDAKFRRQAATDPKISWAVIDTSPWTTCFTLAKAKPQCTDCKEMGHAACRPFLRQGTSSGRYQAYTTTRPICRKFNYNGCDYSDSATSVTYALDATSQHVKLGNSQTRAKITSSVESPFVSLFAPKRQKQLNIMKTVTVK